MIITDNLPEKEAPWVIGFHDFGIRLQDENSLCLGTSSKSEAAAIGQSRTFNSALGSTCSQNRKKQKPLHETANLSQLIGFFNCDSVDTEPHPFSLFVRSLATKNL